jgi:uncharacterized RDD family membrane protein YckC
MVNQQLLDYIKQQLEKNINKEQIKSALMSNGWDTSDVEEGFTAAGPRFSGIPPTPPPPASPSPSVNLNPQPMPNIINPVITPITQPTSNVINPVTTPNIQSVASSINSSAMPISYAGFWLRAAAALIDAFFLNLFLGIIGFLYFAFLVKNNSFLNNNAQTIIGVFSFIVWIIYYPFMESHGGATWGKKIIGIKVLKDGGEPVRFLRSLGRNFAKIISALILTIGFIMAGFGRKKQALHDMITECVVVKTKGISAGRIWAIIILLVIMGISGVVLAFYVIGMHFMLTLFSPLGGKYLELLPNQNNIQFENSGDNINSFPVTTFIPLSAQEYDTYLSIPVAGLNSESDYRGSHIYAGPALIAFDDFWGLNVALPVIPNLENKRDYIWIDLISVISKDGKEILDRGSTFEQSVFFKGLSLSKNPTPIEHLSGNRSVHIVSETKLSDTKTISGTLFFKIPLDSENSINFYEKSYPFVLNI